MDTLLWLIHTPAVVGAVTGLMTAAWADYVAFRSWKSWHDIVTYSWSLATFRWFQGAVVGALTGAGYNVVTS